MTGQSGVAYSEERPPSQCVSPGSSTSPQRRHKTKRLERATALLCRLKVRDTKRVFFTDEKFFYLNPLSATRTTESGRAARKLTSSREREKFAQHVMISAGVCFGDKGRLHFVDESTKVDSAYYVGRLLPSLVDDCTRLLLSG